MRQGYVYALRGALEELQSYLHALGQPLIHWSADEGGLEMGPGAPTDWRDQGAIFGPKGELRWWREDGAVHALLLADEPLADRVPLPGSWETEDWEFDLQNLRDARVHPAFTQYPYGGHRGKLVARIFYRNGVPMFISPRELRGEEG